MRQTEYRGVRRGPDRIVTVSTNNGVIHFNRVLPVRLDLANHSPDGFEWGYGGSGPAQLALAILAYQYGDKYALRHYQDFKWEVIAKLDSDTWELTGEQIGAAMTEFLDSRKARAVVRAVCHELSNRAVLDTNFVEDLLSRNMLDEVAEAIRPTLKGER